MKIYIETGMNGTYGKNYKKYLYMNEYQVGDTADLIEKDKEGNEFIDTKNLNREDYYNKKDFKKIAKKYNINYVFLFETLDWQSPETLAAELEGIGNERYPF